MKNLITNDSMRCDNHICAKRLSCKRYLQLEIDKQTAKGQVSFTTLDAANCQHQLKITPNTQQLVTNNQ